MHFAVVNYYNIVGIYGKEMSCSGSTTKYSFPRDYLFALMYMYLAESETAKRPWCQ